MRKTLLEYHWDALAHNLSEVKRLAPNKKVMSVIKANGYGHDMVAVAHRLTALEPGIRPDALAVAITEEAVNLRESGITLPVMVLEGPNDKEDIRLACQQQIAMAVSTETQLTQICDHATETVSIWLKLDTGMTRMGFAPETFKRAYQSVISRPEVFRLEGFMSHFADADDLSSERTLAQGSLFTDLVSDKPGAKSLCNSAGTIAWPRFHFDFVRPGIMLYGISPLYYEKAAHPAHHLKPLATLKSQLIDVKPVKKGTKVGYNGRWQAGEDTCIGVIAIGYGDGYPRHAPNGTPVLVNGRRVALVGTVSMDMITVDLGIDSADKIGDVCVLWGQGLPVEEVAHYANTIPYELTCKITNRVQRKY